MTALGAAERDEVEKDSYSQLTCACLLRRARYRRSALAVRQCSLWKASSNLRTKHTTAEASMMPTVQERSKDEELTPRIARTQRRRARPHLCCKPLRVAVGKQNPGCAPSVLSLRFAA